MPPVKTVLRLVRVPLYGAQSVPVTERKTRKRPSGAEFYRPVREGRYDTSLTEREEIRMAFISVTRLRVRSWAYMPLFVWRTRQSVRQTERSGGFLGGKLLREARNAFWTMTAWEDEGAMNAFRTSGAHRSAMPKLLDWCDEAYVARWNQETSDLPTWMEAHRRIVEEGRISKVNHPSSDQLAKRIPPPRASRLEQILKPTKSRLDSVHP